MGAYHQYDTEGRHPRFSGRFEERELAMKVFGEEMSLADYVEMKGKNPRTLSDHKRKILSKLQKFFVEHGFEIDNK